MESTNILDLILSKKCDNKQTKGIELIEFDADNQLSANERTFREYGIKDNKGEFTPIALELVLQKVTRDHTGYLLSLIGDKEIKDGGVKKIPVTE